MFIIKIHKMLAVWIILLNILLVGHLHCQPKCEMLFNKSPTIIRYIPYYFQMRNCNEFDGLIIDNKILSCIEDSIILLNFNSSKLYYEYYSHDKLFYVKDTFYIKLHDPLIEVRLGAFLSGSEISPTVLNSAALSVQIINHNIQLGYSVKNFNFIAVINDNIISAKSHNQKISNNQLNLIESLPKGHPFIVDSIVVQKPCGSYTRLAPMVFYRD
jgi:hypothetical protein